jgi:proteasome lid subunit RPN8/RPN11
MENQSGSGLTRWTAAECPFAIEYEPQALDDIRLAVSDAFFSLPRGGAEIGGLLLGRKEEQWVSIMESVGFDCEHAYGPSFVLSPKDRDRLAELIASACGDPGKRVVGWWHSHTRSEIFLSEADLGIHNQFFPEPWQIALVLKPHTFNPMRGGFFFREKDGLIHATAAYREFTLDPLPVKAMPKGDTPPAPAFGMPANGETRGPVIDVAAVTELEAVPPAFEPLPSPEQELIVPKLVPEERPRRGWIGLVAAGLGVAVGVAAYQTRAQWLPRAQAFPGSTSPAAKLELHAVERDGQLLLQWNGDAPAARAAQEGTITILDGSKQMRYQLARQHVLTGSFTYARQSERVDATLSLPQPDGKEAREAVIFSGSPVTPVSKPSALAPAAAPAPAPPAPSAAKPATGPTRDSLAAEVDRLKEENNRQIERNRRLERAVEDLRKTNEQRKRLQSQSPDAAK